MISFANDVWVAISQVNARALRHTGRVPVELHRSVIHSSARSQGVERELNMLDLGSTEEGAASIELLRQLSQRLSC